MNFKQLDLIVPDVPAAAVFFRDVLGLTLRVNEERFAELESGPVTIMLSPDAMIPMKQVAGMILHFEVPNVIQALERARSFGVTVLMGPTRTEWGTESAMIAGPDGLVIDFYRFFKEGEQVEV